MSVCDYNLFRKLDHLSLAQHVFPLSFYGSGHNVLESRMVGVNAIVDIMQTNMHINVIVGFKEWSTNSFGKVIGNKLLPKPVKIVRDNIQKKDSCILFCRDCRLNGNVCTPIAKIRFSGDTESSSKGPEIKNCVATVECLYFHNSHSWTVPTMTLFAGGFVSLNMSRDFIAGDTYNNGIAKGRLLLHKEKGVISKSTLGKKCPSANDKKNCKEFLFTYIVDEWEKNRAYMMASNPNPEDWSLRLPRNAFCTAVDASAHISNMVRLYYCISVQLGISRLAAPFEIHYNDQGKMSGSTPNPEHECFIQEESMLVGGFVNKGIPLSQNRHTDYDKPSLFSPSKPKVAGLRDGSHLYSYGFSIIMSLLHSEERVVYMGNEAGKINVDTDEALVFLGNMPHGGVTHLIQTNSDKVWPALHVHMDKLSTAREVDFIGNIKEGFGHTDEVVDCSIVPEDYNSEDGVQGFHAKRKRQSSK